LCKWQCQANQVLNFSDPANSSDIAGGLLAAIIETKKLSGKILNAFCKCYFQHSNSNQIFSSGWNYFKVFGKRRKLPSQEKVRPTTHRYGRTARFPWIFSEI
jgi:hypothetical protein